MLFRSLAIGKRGQNVRLASRLTNWRIDVKSESRHLRQRQSGYQSLLSIPGMAEETADKLFEAGVGSPEELVEAVLIDLEDATRIASASLAMLQEEARKLLAAGPLDETEEASEEDDDQAAAEPPTEEDDAPPQDSADSPAEDEVGQ